MLLKTSVEYNKETTSFLKQKKFEALSNKFKMIS